jgi:hypothetical protein
MGGSAVFQVCACRCQVRAQGTITPRGRWTTPPSLIGTDWGDFDVFKIMVVFDWSAVSVLKLLRNVRLPLARGWFLPCCVITVPSGTKLQVRRSGFVV